MTIYKFGEVILVQFPFTDQTTSKKRPAVVISSERYNREQPDIILMAVTSQLRHAGKGIDATIRDWQKAGLIKQSLIKPVITTIEKRLILKTLGHLSKIDRCALQDVLSASLGKS